MPPARCFSLPVCSTGWPMSRSRLPISCRGCELLWSLPVRCCLRTCASCWASSWHERGNLLLLHEERQQDLSFAPIKHTKRCDLPNPFLSIYASPVITVRMGTSSTRVLAFENNTVSMSKTRLRTDGRDTCFNATSPDDRHASTAGSLGDWACAVLLTIKAPITSRSAIIFIVVFPSYFPWLLTLHRKFGSGRRLLRLCSPVLLIVLPVFAESEPAATAPVSRIS